MKDSTKIIIGLSILFLCTMALSVLFETKYNNIFSELHCGSKNLDLEVVYNKTYFDITVPSIGYKCCTKAEEIEVFDNKTGIWNYKFIESECFFVPLKEESK